MYVKSWKQQSWARRVMLFWNCNWCGEDTLQEPLGLQDIQPVHSEKAQPWVPLMFLQTIALFVKRWLFGKRRFVQLLKVRRKKRPTVDQLVGIWLDRREDQVSSGDSVMNPRRLMRYSILEVWWTTEWLNWTQMLLLSNQVYEHTSVSLHDFHFAMPKDKSSFRLTNFILVKKIRLLL